jgi:hypothetical protein
MVNWSLKRAFAAMNRSDVDLVVPLYEPDAVVFVRGMSGVGIRDHYSYVEPPAASAKRRLGEG